MGEILFLFSIRPNQSVSYLLMISLQHFFPFLLTVHLLSCVKGQSWPFRILKSCLSLTFFLIRLLLLLLDIHHLNHGHSCIQSQISESVWLILHIWEWQIGPFSTVKLLLNFGNPLWYQCAFWIVCCSNVEGQRSIWIFCHFLFLLFASIYISVMLCLPMILTLTLTVTSTVSQSVIQLPHHHHEWYIFSMMLQYNT